MENVTLTPKEQSRLQVLNSLLAEQVTLDQAAELMGVSTRHARRMLAAYRECGAAALAHGHRDRKPSNATPEAVIADLVRLAKTKYEGANHTHLAELLAEREGIHIGRTTLRRILLNAGLSSPCPASTRNADFCCLIQKCYRNFSTWGPPQPALIPALQGVPPWARQPWRRPALCS